MEKSRVVNGFRFHRLRSAMKRTSSFPQPTTVRRRIRVVGVSGRLVETSKLLLVYAANPPPVLPGIE